MGDRWIKSLRLTVRKVGMYMESVLIWMAIAILIGVCCGLLGSAFHIGVDSATEIRAEHPWLLFTMPLIGLLIVALYKFCHTVGQGTNDILDAANDGNRLTIWLVPSIFFGTVLTHLAGGSSGREGAALQMGGSIGQNIGKLFKFKEHDLKVATMCGMAAFFSALFGTPFAAALFAIMVSSVGTFVHMAFFPCLISSLTAYVLSMRLGVEPTRFAITVPAFSVEMLARVALISCIFALLSVIFCEVMHKTEELMKKGFLADPLKRVVFGGLLLIVLTLLSGTTDYNGAGMNVIVRAVEQGQARPEAFLMKLLFTAITLSAGYKGGVVVPSFFVGATFGAVAAPFFGIPAGFGAALGLIGVFCGATNCMLSSIILSIELFGSEGVLFFALLCSICYILSGYSGLYSSQIILFSKVHADYLKVKTNHHHLNLEKPQPENMNVYREDDE